MGEDITPTLISGISKQNGTTQDKLNVMVLNGQGGAVMNTSEDIAGALRAQEHGHQPIVYGISAYESNGMKSPNPHSGIYEADTTRTLDNNGGNPACNQGGMISHKGDGYAESEVSYTLNAVEQHAVCLENHPADSRVKIREDGVCQTLSGRMGTGGGNVPMVMENAVCIGNGQTAQTRISDKVGALNCMHDQQAVMQGISGDVAGTLDASYYKGCGERQGVEREVVASSVVRQLTPLECERLQGYPDHWTDIGEWTDSKGKKHKDADSPRYKALGNSIALPFWEWMAKRMAQYLPEGATMASLFSGIGGFELVFARAGVKPIWNSEIESFPEAVTTVHFGDDERGIKGDYERYL